MVELIAKRYGTALFDLSVENNEVDKIKQEVVEIMTLIENDKDLLGILSHPRITTEDKEKMIEEIFEGKISDYLLGLIDLTIKKSRQGELLEIFDYFLSKVDELNNIAKVKVTTVEPLTDDYRTRLVKKLETITGKTIVLEELVDQSIIGGIIVRISDRIVDNSIKGQVRILSKNLLVNT